MKPKQSTILYPTLRKPLSLVAQFLDPGDSLENVQTLGPYPLPKFSVMIPHTDDSPNHLKQHLEYLQGLPPDTLTLYTDGSKLDNQIDWVSMGSLPTTE